MGDGKEKESVNDGAISKFHGVLMGFPQEEYYDDGQSLHNGGRGLNPAGLDDDEGGYQRSFCILCCFLSQ